MHLVEKEITLLDELNEKIKVLYIFYADLDEKEIKKERKLLYKEAIDAYGTWEKALVTNGITKRKIREREKFVLYYLLKVRFEKYGVEAIRPKNVHPDDIKNRIVHSFKTLKTLKDIVLNWNEEKVMYELHAVFLTGTPVDTLKEKFPELYEQMLGYFSSYTNALNEYNKRFGLPDISPEKNPMNETNLLQTRPQKVNNEEVDDLMSMLIKLRYIDNKSDAKAITEANRLRKEEVNSFLLHALAEAQISGIPLTEDTIKTKNPVIYFAMKVHYSHLDNAFYEITKQFVKVD